MGWVDVNILFFKDSIGFRVGFDGKVGIVKGEDIKGFGGIVMVDFFDEFGLFVIFELVLVVYEE